MYQQAWEVIEVLTPETMQRLTFIKYLYGQGVEQSRQAQPNASASILTLHDSVELFMHLACDEHKVDAGKKADFADYLGRLKSERPELQLTGTGTLNRLNTARVGLKHHANLPDEQTIADLRGRVGIFFEDNTPVLFGIEFSKITMVSLVVSQQARASLEEAERLISDENIIEAIEQVAIAFAQLVDEHRRSTSARSRGLPLGSDIFMSPFPIQVGSLAYLKTNDTTLSRLIAEVKNIAEAVSSVQKQTQNLAASLNLGLDAGRLATFHRLAPQVYRLLGGGSGIEYKAASRTKVPPTAQEYAFCFNFVVDSAIRLQEFMANPDSEAN